MILLDTVNKSAEVILAGAITTNQLPYTLTYVELDSSFQIAAVAANDGATNSTTAVSILAAPIAGKVRQVKYISVYNKDTVAAIVTIRLNNNGTFREIVKRTLQPGETLEYVS